MGTQAHGQLERGGRLPVLICHPSRGLTLASCQWLKRRKVTERAEGALAEGRVTPDRGPPSYDGSFQCGHCAPLSRSPMDPAGRRQSWLCRGHSPTSTPAPSAALLRLALCPADHRILVSTLRTPSQRRRPQGKASSLGKCSLGPLG